MSVLAKKKIVASPEFEADLSLYESYPYHLTHPVHLYTLAKLHGIEAANFKNCRILEIACANGNNIMPIAHRFPECKIVGIDINTRLIEKAKETAFELGLNNIEFHDISVTDINKDFGTFDYIIAHGLFSWVSDEVRQAILNLYQNNLARNGIGYISYNTYPGWSYPMNIRNIALEFTKNIEDKKTKAIAARNITGNLKTLLQGNNSPHAMMLSQEAELIENNPDFYFANDHLGEINQPFYFFEFADMLTQHNLQFICESNIALSSTVVTSNQANQIIANTNDLREKEQLIDIIKNCRFRSSLICNKDISVNRNINAEKIAEFYISSNLKPQGVVNKDIVLSNANIGFSSSDKLSLNVNDSYGKAALLTLHEQGNNVIKIDQLISQTNNKYPELDIKKLESSFGSILPSLLFSGGINITSFAGNYANKVSNKPEVDKYIRYEAKKRDWVTNLRHNKISITDTMIKQLLPIIDGKRNKKALIEFIVDKLLTGEIKNKNNATVLMTKEELTTKIENFLKILLDHALLLK